MSYDGFENDRRTFQERCWSRLYDTLLVKYFENFEYVGEVVTVTFRYSKYRYLEPLDMDYNEAIINKTDYCRQLSLTTNIRKNSDGDSIDSDGLGSVLIPELTPRGFIIGGHAYDIANMFREAYGWYITTDKNKNIILSMKTSEGGKYIITNSNDQLYIEHNGKKIGFGTMLKAVTGLTATELLSEIDMSNTLVVNTISGQLGTSDGEKTDMQCILEAVYLTSGGKVTIEELSKKPDDVLRETLTYNLNRVNIGNEGYERYKKFITFQRRAEGSVLSDAVTLSDGSVIAAGTNLGRMDLIRLDNDESITNIVVEYQGTIYNIKKFPIDEGKFNYNMLLNIANISFVVFSGLGILDDRDSLENRVIENVAEHIVECLDEYLRRYVCRQIDSYKNRSEDISVSILAGKLESIRNSDYILQRYKKETIVQLKDDVNILSEVTKTYKLSYKRKSAKARVGDAVRNIKVKQYMRVCPIDTPESKEVGLNTYLTATAGVDDNGFITASYVEIATGKIVYMNALDEMGIPIMVWNEDINSSEFVRAHIDGEFMNVHRSMVKYKDVGPTGLLSLSTGYVPYIGNNKAKRALMATNMNRQAVHMLGSERPRVTTATDNMLDTGITRAKDVIMRWAKKDGITPDEDLLYNTEIVISNVERQKGKSGYLRSIIFHSNSSVLSGYLKVDLPYYMTSTSGHYYYMRIVQGKSRFKGNDIVYMHRDIQQDDLTVANNPKFGDSIGINNDRINECGYALGKDLTILFKVYKGFTYEDAVVINRNLFEDKSLTSIYVTEVRSELQYNPMTGVNEEFGIDGLNFTSEERKYMRSSGLPAIGSYVRGGQVVIGKIRTEVSQHGNDKVENASMFLDSKSEGWILDARIIRGDSRSDKSDVAVVSIISLKDVGLGDKFVGRHGNKGVVARIVPAEDLPFGEDGTIPDIVLNPLGIIARGNVGQLCECIVGMAGYKMNRRFVIPDLSDENYETMQACREILTEKYGFQEQTVYDGETGLPYDKKMLFGVMHMYKLLHLAERPYKVIGAANNAVQEVSQQPRNGQRISELQVNAYIAHGATETLDAFMSVQSDDISGASNLQKRIREQGSSLDSGTDIKSENKSDELVRAYLRTLGADIITVDGGVRFKYLTNRDILDISGNGTENVVEGSNNNEVSALHDEAIFGPEAKNLSRKLGFRVRRRKNYGRIEFGYNVIMPIIFRNAQFLKRFQFLFITFEKLSSKDEDGFENYFLKVLVERKSVSTKTVGILIEGGYTSLAFCSNSLCIVDTKTLDKLGDKDLISEADKFLKDVGFNTSELVSKYGTNKFYSPHKIDKLADMYMKYNNENLVLAGQTLSRAYDEYLTYLSLNTEYGSEESEGKFKFVISALAAISSMNNHVGICGSEYFVSKMLVMPACFRPRYAMSHGERYNDIDATYIDIMSAVSDLKNRLDRTKPIEFEVSRLYQALDECYKRNNNKKNNISIADMLLTSNVNKVSTVIRGHVGAKRISYSSRAVITVNPNLKLTECGIPYKQALILWEDNLIWALGDKQIIEGKTALTEQDIRKLLKYLVDNNYYAIGYDLFDVHVNPIQVAKQIESIVVDELVDIMKDEIVVLNREPALHKFNCMSFVPVLCDGISIQLHPMVCTAYNADFDGDTMSAFVCKTDTAKREAKEKMMTINNIINPKDGKNILTLKQDIVLGLYMLTMLRGNSEEEITVLDRVPVSFYNNVNQIEQDIDVGFISIYDCVALQRKARKGKGEYFYISTAGRILFNSLLPDGAGFNQTPISKDIGICTLKYDMRVDSKVLSDIVVECFENNSSNKVTIDLLDRMKVCGIKYADKSGATISINDFEDKSYLVEEDIEKVQEIVDRYDMYEKLKLFPTADKKAAVVDLWKRKLDVIQKKVEDSMDVNGSVYAIINSGARGAKSDFNAISGVIGQVRNVDNTIIERPILGNFLKGLSADEYFISTYQARRGQISTSTKTADSGENNRAISHMLNNVKVVREDCEADAYHLKLKWGKLLKGVADGLIGKTITGCKYNYFIGKKICASYPDGCNRDEYLTIDGLELTQLINIELDGVETKIPRKLDGVHRSLLMGRVVEEDGNDWLPNNLHSLTDYADVDSRTPERTLTSKSLDFIEQNPEEYINVRLLIGCKAHGGVCSKCYGRDIENKKLIEVGKYIGLISAMAISEVATQGTMNVHHATASSSGMGSIAERFKNNLNAKSFVNVVRTYDNELGEYKYEVSMRKADGQFAKVADNLNAVEAIKEQGLALADGIIHVTNRTNMDGKTVVNVISNDGVYDYHIDKRNLVVADGQEVRKYQPLMAPYDYNQIMKLDSDYAREFFIIDFADIFISSGNNVRAIHFELIGREQTNYTMVKYTVDGTMFEEAFPRYMSDEEINDELKTRYNPAVVSVVDNSPMLIGRSKVMDSRDIIANTFSREVFSKVGKYCMNGKVDRCTSPLTNLFTGRKVRGNDGKVFSTQNPLQKDVSRHTEIYDDGTVMGELDASNDTFEDTFGEYGEFDVNGEQYVEVDTGDVESLPEETNDFLSSILSGDSTDISSDDEELAAIDGEIEVKESERYRFSDDELLEGFDNIKIG